MTSREALKSIIDEYHKSVIEQYYKSEYMSKQYRHKLYERYDERFNIIEKSLKAFNVIKDNLSVVNYGIVGNDTEPEYWLVYNNLMLKKLTYEEYDLLKEVLK